MTQAFYSVLRWWTRRFRTRVAYRPDPFGRPECWSVERPNWWELGSLSGVTDVTVEEARRRLDEWQDDQFARSRA